jgi:hypothetical protein
MYCRLIFLCVSQEACKMLLFRRKLPLVHQPSLKVHIMKTEITSQVQILHVLYLNNRSHGWRASPQPQVLLNLILFFFTWTTDWKSRRYFTQFEGLLLRMTSFWDIYHFGIEALEQNGLSKFIPYISIVFYLLNKYNDIFHWMVFTFFLYLEGYTQKPHGLFALLS